MIKRPHLYICIVIISTLLVAFYSCKKEEKPAPEFDRGLMLENVGNAIIIPAYENLDNKAQEMDSAVIRFTAAPDLANLVKLQDAFIEAYLAWQDVSLFEFGPAEQLLLRANTNTFPADTIQIGSNISSGTYNLAAVSNLDAKGFPAMDYLLFGTAAGNNAILDKYSSDADSAKRKKYLKDISKEIRSNVNSVYNSWVPGGGNYIHTFINNTGTNVGSSLGLLVNQLNYDFELLKNYKIGIPLGKKTLGTPLPEKTEGYYSKRSAQLAVAHIKAIENTYSGRSRSGTDGSGLDDYLVHLQAAYNGGMLSDAIKAQLALTISKLQSIPDPLSETIMNDPSVADAAYVELQKQVVLFKTDMPSALGVLITYQDNDGD